MAGGAPSAPWGNGGRSPAASAMAISSPTDASRTPRYATLAPFRSLPFGLIDLCFLQNITMNDDDEGYVVPLAFLPVFFGFGGLEFCIMEH